MNKGICEIVVMTTDDVPGLLLDSALDRSALARLQSIRDTTRRRKLRPGKRPLCLMCPAEFGPHRAPAAYVFATPWGAEASEGIGAAICQKCGTALDPASVQAAVTKAFGPLLGEGRILPPLASEGTA